MEIDPTNLMPIPADFFLRRADIPSGEEKTVIMGLLDKHQVPANHCQLWVGHIILVPQRRFILPDKYEGYRIEDLLMERFDTGDLQEIT